MRANLELTGGLVMAESVTMALAARIGRSAAHELITRACQQAIKEKSSLGEALLYDAEFSAHMTHDELESALDPAKYLGSARQAIERILQRASAARSEANPTFVELPGIRTHYRSDGPADKPVLLFSNGLGTNLTMWDGQVAEFSKRFRVLRYDQRGHGRSSVPAGAYSIERFGRDVVSLLDRLGIERCYFCGLSMGGMIGQWLGTNAPERLAGLVLCNTAAKIGTAEGWNNRIDLVGKGGMEAAIPLVLDRWYTPAFQANAPEVIARARKMLLSTVPEGYVATCAAIRDMDQRETVRYIRVRTLVVAGAHDGVTSPDEGKYLADNIAGAKYVELPAAHLSNVEAPAEFNAAVLQFLAG
jgi:3-oxoadipate enol-lactonase